MVPPPQCPPVDSRLKPKKRSNPSSSKIILFAIQRKNPKFPQYIKVHLVTQFSVHLRVFPFSDQPQKIPISQNLSRFRPNDLISAQSHRPIIKGLRADLILSATRFNITHFLIYFFIQKSF
jgi:hypothetical protein